MKPAPSAGVYQPMHRTVGWLAIGLIFTLIGGAAFWRSDQPPVRVSLIGGGELRVIKVSLGTNHVFSAEPLWKQVLRGVLPQSWEKPLGPIQGHQFGTRHDSLMVWVAELDPQGRAVKHTTFKEPAAVFADGTIASGQLRLTKGNDLFFEFDCFPRDLRQVALQVRDVTETLKFSLNNPRPMRPANWIAGEIPQTNHLSKTRVELRQLMLRTNRASNDVELIPSVRAFAQGEGGIGWMRWRFTAVNACGNWKTTPWSLGSGIPAFPPADSTWKLIVEGEEYLSAGFVTQPAPGSWSVLPPSPRARELGLRAAVLVGPGGYRFASRGDSATIDGAKADLPSQSLKLIGPAGTTNWVLEINTPQIGILCLTELGHGGPEIRARLRERDSENRSNAGVAYSSLTTMTATIAMDGRQLLAQFFVPRWFRPPMGWPSPAIQIEAEIIVAHPPTEFFIDPSKADPPAARHAAPATPASDRNH